jgi:hypothetical protein
MKKLIALTILCLSSLTFAARWDNENVPFKFNKVIGTQMITNFTELPLVGKVSDDRILWSETYWPANKGGIAYRWNHPDPQPFKYKLHTLEEVRNMTQEELGQLSPAELYDIAQGDFNYALTKKTLSLFSERDLWWEGICHGWAPAAANFPEPSQVLVTSPQGIKVPFGSSDVKGLLAMYDAYNYNRKSYADVGKRCRIKGKVPGEEDARDGTVPSISEEDSNSAACSDVNAGSFHLIMTNLIGIHSKGFVADIDRYNDVWNQPIHSYTSKVLQEEPLDPTDTGVARRVRIEMIMTFGEELKFYTPELAAQGKLNFVSKLPVTNTVHQMFLPRRYEYILELDDQGRIIGGEWITATRPDFMWTITKEQKFSNSPIPLGGLNTIYRPVRR